MKFKAVLLSIACLYASLCLSISFVPLENENESEAFSAILKSRNPGADTIFVDDMRFKLSTGQKSGFYGNKWTNGIVYYEFDPAVTSTQRSNWIAAAEEWSSTTSLQFVPRTVESNYIYVFSGDGNWSWVGMIGGRQEMSITNWNYRFIIAHEIGHALGAAHEHSRQDRDSYVSINLANIQDSYEDNFEAWNTTDYGAYDFDSVMHYDKCAFSVDCPPGTSCNCSNYAITVLPPNGAWQDAIGQRDHLSALDIAGMASRYGDLPSVEIDIDMPFSYYAPGDYCYLDCSVFNNESYQLDGYPLFIVLEIYGQYYCGPTFTSFDYYDPMVASGYNYFQIIPTFEWPNGAGTGNARFYGAMTNPHINQLIGNLDTVDFSWGY